MKNRRVGLWLLGAFGGVGSTAALGLAAWKQGLMDGTSLTTALPLFADLDLDGPEQFVLGGHEIRTASFAATVDELHQRANIFDAALMQACRPQLDEWSGNVRPGTVLNAGATITRMAEFKEALKVESARAILERLQADLREFKTRQQLDQVVVVNVASTEPPFTLAEPHASMARLVPLLDGKDPLIPASSLYAWAALDLGMPYVNFTPSLGTSFGAALELAQARKTLMAGKDGKTGETLMKSVLAPMFARRNFRILSWVGHNIFGNRDGQVLDDPVNKASKIRTKDQLIQQIVGYQPKTHVSIEYIDSMDDWKTAWDHIHFQGFLGTKMIMQFIWQGCDSILAAPLVLDLARLTLLAQRRGEVGIARHLACFFKSPMGVEDHDFFKQFALLENYVKS